MIINNFCTFSLLVCDVHFLKFSTTSPSESPSDYYSGWPLLGGQADNGRRFPNPELEWKHALRRNLFPWFYPSAIPPPPSLPLSLFTCSEVCKSMKGPSKTWHLGQCQKYLMSCQKDMGSWEQGNSSGSDIPERMVRSVMNGPSWSVLFCHYSFGVMDFSCKGIYAKKINVGGVPRLEVQWCSMVQLGRCPCVSIARSVLSFFGHASLRGCPT